MLELKSVAKIKTITRSLFKYEIKWELLTSPVPKSLAM